MDEVDETPLDQPSRRDLQILISNAAAARDLAKPGQRAKPEKVAQAVLVAFRLNHKIVNGKWTPMRVFRLQGGALVVRDVTP